MLRDGLRCLELVPLLFLDPERVLLVFLVFFFFFFLLDLFRPREESSLDELLPEDDLDEDEVEESEDEHEDLDESDDSLSEE